MPSTTQPFLATLTDRLIGTAQFDAIGSSLSNPRANVPTVCPEPANPLLIAAVWRKLQVPTLVITPNPDSAQRIVDQLPTWTGTPDIDEDGSPIHHFIETGGIPFERYEPDRGTAHRRIVALDALRNYSISESQPPLVVASVQAVAERTAEPQVFDESFREIKIGDRIDIAETMRHLTRAGYEVQPTVEQPGTAARRGGIIDIFPVGANDPIRIEFFDDEVDTMRLFDVETQRSFDDVEKIHIIPAREELPTFVEAQAIRDSIASLNTDNIDFTRLSAHRLSDELNLVAEGALDNELAFYAGFFNRGSIFQYLPKNCVVIALRPRMIADAATGIDRRLDETRRVKERRAEVPINFPIPHIQWPDLAQNVEAVGHRLEIDPFGIDSRDIGNKRPLPIKHQLLPNRIDPTTLDPIETDESGETPVDVVLDDPTSALKRAIEDGADQVIAITSHPARLYELSQEANIQTHYEPQRNLPIDDRRPLQNSVIPAEAGASAGGTPIQRGGAIGASSTRSDSVVPSPAGRERARVRAKSPVVIAEGYATSGFQMEFDGGETACILTDAEIFGIRRQRRRTHRRTARRGPQLEQLQPGVYIVHVDHGIAKFLGTETKEPDGREHLVLQYAKDDRVYVPTEHIDRIQIYQGGGETAPRLSKLGTSEWRSARRRAKQATEIVANELLGIYAARMLANGIQVEPDTPWQHVLEASFPFEETPDQLTALQAVKTDMESAKSMDRIICGDVGFGKTEIALRSAFKAVQNGRQAAVLVPTTLLAQQHYDTFRERLAPFPVAIDVISRFRSREDQQDILQRLAEGKIDIIIGTHRLIQRDIAFNNLGLVVIDEEQKFGVKHKEHMKRLRAAVDVLTLSATPIPRTLYMSIAGIRDMSNMETAPDERLPVRTFVSESSDDLIREAILRELDRGGQVFFLHNRVKGIERVSRRLRELVPEASFTIGHGQMPEGQLEEVITAFDRREYDVLICTTIIEAGIDMPNVNTLIVDDADRFGLAQLHHIRGRVGRGAKQGFAYLLVQPNKSLTEEADARLNTILAATELGSGFKIAMRDLEIRGMGNVIGAEQSGHVAAIGLHLYTQLLSQSVEELRRKLEQSPNGKATDTETQPRNGQSLPSPSTGSAGISPSTRSAGHTFPSPSGGSAEGDGGALNGHAPKINGVADPDWQPPSMIRADIRLGIDDNVPPEYIENLAQRLSFHQRLSWVSNQDEIEELRDELRDRYGPIPESVEGLLETARIRLLAEEADCASVRTSEDRARIVMNSPAGGAKPQLQRLLGPQARVGNTQIIVEAGKGVDTQEFVQEIAAVLETIRNFKQRVMALVNA